MFLCICFVHEWNSESPQKLLNLAECFTCIEKMLIIIASYVQVGWGSEEIVEC